MQLHFSGIACAEKSFYAASSVMIESGINKLMVDWRWMSNAYFKIKRFSL